MVPERRYAEPLPMLFARDLPVTAETPEPAVSPEIEVWRFELHEGWRDDVKVVARMNYAN